MIAGIITIIVLLVVDLALSILVLSVLGEMTSRLRAGVVNRNSDRTARIVAETIRAVTGSRDRVPHYDA